jgi:putative spermidine/putrescine transport system substrate-binding protein
LDSIKDQIAWYEHGAQSVQLVADGESSLGSTWNGRAYQPKLDGAPVDYTFSNNFLVFGSWTMPKGGKNTKWAQEFIAHTLDPKNQAIVSENVPYIAPAKKTMELLSAERKAVLPDLSQGTWQNVSFWAEHGDAIYERFTAWLIG